MKISIILPSRNNLKYLKWSYSSIRKNIDKDTEIVLLDDASTDGTYEWLENLKCLDNNIVVYHNPSKTERLGHCILYDKGIELCKNDIFMIFHADMYMSPNAIKNSLENLSEKTVVSLTRVEPLLHPPGPEKESINFGLEPDDFKEQEFLNFVSIKECQNKSILSNGIFAPWLMTKKDFNKINGHDKKVFAPMELEDSDLFNRFFLKGYKLIQSRSSFVYHMTCRGSRYKDGIKIKQKIDLGNGQIWLRPEDSEEYTKLRQIKFREWWRKWHMNVLHDENMMPKVCKRYDVGFIMRNCLTPIIGVIFNKIEPWCDTFYTDLPSHLIEQYITNEEERSQFDIRKKLKPLTAEKTNNVLVEFDAKNWHLTYNDYVENTQPYKLIENLMFIIEDSGEVGEFEYDIFKITIKSMESYEKNLIDSNDMWYLNKLKDSTPYQYPV